MLVFCVQIFLVAIAMLHMNWNLIFTLTYNILVGRVLSFLLAAVLDYIHNTQKHDTIQLRSTSLICSMFQITASQTFVKCQHERRRLFNMY